MRLTDFDYALPAELIAQQPAERRDASRLLVLDRANGSCRSDWFSHIASYFRPGDVLVRNDTRVIPARLLGRKDSGGRVEVFLVRQLSVAADGLCWRCLTRSSKPVRPGQLLYFAEGLKASVLALGEGGERDLCFHHAGDFSALLDRIGQVPLPPYITRPAEADDRERYQTTFARVPGAVAAPTAGLHFTPECFARLERLGVALCNLTLHVGLGTFLPVRVEDPRHHCMHEEAYAVPQATAATINRARAEGRRIVALGTTVARTLEAASMADGHLRAGDGLTDIFIYPGYRFRQVDALVTNFHLPQSTLLMLVCALAGREAVLAAYARAVAEGYRFFSYGDCMFIQ